MNCPFCGKETPDDSQYCTNCGLSLATDQSSTVSMNNMNAETMPLPNAVPAAPVEESTNQQLESTEKRSIKIPIIIGAAVLALILISAIVFAVLNIQADDSQKSTTTQKTFSIDETTMPDQALRDTVIIQTDANQDGILSEDEIQGLTDLSLEGVDDLKGLENFPNLSTLSVSDTSMTTLDASPMSNLSSLNVQGDSLESVSVKDMQSLTSLNVSGDSVESVDVSGASSLATINVPGSSEITGIDTTSCKEVWLPTAVHYGGNSGVEEFYRYEFERDDSGKLITLNEGNIQQGEWLSVPTTYEYDDEGKLSAVNGVAVSYNDSGQLVDSADASNSTPIQYNYDEDGKLISVTDGSNQSSNNIYTYDDQGNLIAHEQYRAHNSWSYDSDGRVVSYSLPASTGGGYVTGSLSYNSDDETIPTHVDATCIDRVASIDYSFNDQDQVVSASGTADDSSYESEVVFDEFNNPVEVTTMSTDGSSTVAYCSIEYQRYILPKDSNVQSEVVVAPDYFAAMGSSDLIEVYVMEPEIVRASESLPIGIDDQYCDQNIHP